jgi:hypothetical protein
MNTKGVNFQPSERGQFSTGEGCVRVWRRYKDGWYACVHYTTADAHHLATFPGKNVRNTIPPW